MNKRRGFQVSIRTLLIFTFLSAIAVVVWINRPSGLVAVEIEENGSLLLDGDLVKLEDLHEGLNSKFRWHRFWAMKCDLQVTANESTPTSVVSEIVDDGSLPEFDSVLLRVNYSVSVPTSGE